VASRTLPGKEIVAMALRLEQLEGRDLLSLTVFPFQADVQSATPLLGPAVAADQPTPEPGPSVTGSQSLALSSHFDYPQSLGAAARALLAQEPTFTSCSQFTVTLAAVQDSPGTPAGSIPGSPFNPSRLLSARAPENAAVEEVAQNDPLGGESIPVAPGQRVDTLRANEGIAGTSGGSVSVAGNRTLDRAGADPTGVDRVSLDQLLLTPRSAFSGVLGLTLNPRVPPGGVLEEDAAPALVLPENLFARGETLVLGLVLHGLVFGSPEEQDEPAPRGRARLQVGETDR
jgi:hypothetical protein